MTVKQCVDVLYRFGFIEEFNHISERKDLADFLCSNLDCSIICRLGLLNIVREIESRLNIHDSRQVNK